MNNKARDDEKKEIDQIEVYIKNEQFSEAMKAFENLKNNRDSFRAKYLKAKALAGLKDLQGALEILTELNKLHPENLNVILKIADTLKGISDYTKAVEFYNKALFLDPFNQEAKEIIEEIKGFIGRSEESQSKESKSVEQEETSKDFIDFERIDTGSEIKKNIEISHKESDNHKDEKFDFEEQVKSEKIQKKTNSAENDLLEKDDQNLPTEDKITIEDADQTDQLNSKDSEQQQAAKSNPDENTPEINENKEPLEDSEYGFITESAAKLYEEQDLFDEAILIYEKLEKAKDAPGSYGDQITGIRNKKKNFQIIKKLEKFKNDLIEGVQGV